MTKKLKFTGGKHYGFVDFGGQNISNKALVFMLVRINDAWKIPKGYFLIRNLNSEQKQKF